MASNAACKIVTCTCDHTFQDETYGKKRRVANPKSADKPENQVYRCTVCKTERK